MGAQHWLLILVNEGVQVQLLPAFEGLSTDRAGERVAGVEQSVLLQLLVSLEASSAVGTGKQLAFSILPLWCPLLPSGPAAAGFGLAVGEAVPLQDARLGEALATHGAGERFGAHVGQAVAQQVGRGRKRLLTHLAGEELLSGVAEDVSAEEPPACEGLATVGADVGERGAGPVLHQLGWRGEVGVRLFPHYSLLLLFLKDDWIHLFTLVFVLFEIVDAVHSDSRYFRR